MVTRACGAYRRRTRSVEVGKGGVRARARPGVAATTSRRSTLSLTFSVPPRRRVRDSFRRAKRRSRKRRFSRVGRRLTTAAETCGLFSLPFSGNQRDEPLRFRAAAAAFVPPLSVRARGCRAGVSARSPSEMGKKAKGKHRLGACPLPSSPNRPPPLAPAPFPRNRRRRRRLSGDDAPTTRATTSEQPERRVRRKRGRVPATPRLGVDRARVSESVSLALDASASPRAPRLPSRRRRSPPPLFPSSQIAQTSSTTWRRSRATARARRSSSCS